jgi:hypothetical protein
VIAIRSTDGPSARAAFERANQLEARDPAPAGDDENARRRCALQAFNLEGAIKHPSPAVHSPHFSVPGVTMPWGSRA